MRRTIAGLLAVFAAACATLGPRTEGVSGPITYQATDMELGRRPNGNYYYSFNVLVTETQGAAITFTEIHAKLYQPGVGPWTPLYRGNWTLPANGQFRIPLSSTITCPHTVPACQGTNVPIPFGKSQ